MKGRQDYWVVLAGPAVTLGVDTWSRTTDPFNAPKLLLLGIVAGFGLAQFVFHSKSLQKIHFSPELGVALLLICALVGALIFSGSPISQQFYGAVDRNLGFLHYLFLTFIFLGSTTVNFQYVWPRTIKSLVYIGSAQAFYAIIQFIGMDPAPWKNPNNLIFGTLGNPDFLSSFMALSAISTFYFINIETRVRVRLLFVFSFILQILVIYLSTASQGLVLLGFGLAGIFLLKMYGLSRKLGLITLAGQSLILCACALGIFQHGPLARYLYQDSISFRGDYWRAGLAMFTHNWFHGVGLDSYGDYFLMYRDTRAISRHRFEVVSNSAHNLFIDLGSTGGIFLLVAYIALILLVALKIYRMLRRKISFPVSFQYLVLLWLCFNLQTLVSINVSSIAVWGWIFSGLILAFEVNDTNKSALKSKNRSSRNFDFIWISILFVGIFAGAVLPQLSKNSKLADAFARNNPAVINQALMAYPRNAEQMSRISEVYKKLGYDDMAIELARESLNENPNSVRALRIIARSPKASLNEARLAASRLKKFDPLWEYSDN
jgi:O-antigen ligase